MKKRFFPLEGNPFTTYCFLRASTTGLYLAGHQAGLAYFYVEAGRYAPFQQYNEFEGLKSATVYYMYQNQAGIWMATSKGIFLADEKKGIIRQFSVASGDLPVDCIIHLHENHEYGS